MKRKSSQVNKEELAAKETLSQQYVEKETRKVGSPARTSLSGTTSTPRSSSSSSTPRSNASGDLDLEFIMKVDVLPSLLLFNKDLHIRTTGSALNQKALDN